MSKRRGRVPPYVAKQRAAGEQQFMAVIVTERADTLTRFIDEVFETDPLNEGIVRLKGLGGATGVITITRLQEIAQAIIANGLEVADVDGEAQAESGEEAGAADQSRREEQG